MIVPRVVDDLAGRTEAGCVPEARRRLEHCQIPFRICGRELCQSATLDVTSFPLSFNHPVLCHCNLFLVQCSTSRTRSFPTIALGYSTMFSGIPSSKVLERLLLVRVMRVARFLPD